ncbi:MAG: tripartite tricarboxylate transporter substrate binding protein [Xanthobacteraceae bacterium]
MNLLNRSLNRNWMLVLYAVLFWLPGTNSNAQGWPTRPITLIMPFAAGGSTDLYGRALAEFASRKHGITIVVENRPGAGGLIGVNAVRQAAPDGYTLGYFGSTNAIALRFIDKGILVGRDVQAIGQIAKTAVITVVNPNANSARSLAELVSYLRLNPGTTYATVGVGSMTHMLVTAFARNNNISVVHVPYKGGAHASAALLGGEIGIGIGLDPQSTLPLIESGQFVALAYSARKRLKALPNVPTVYEQGFPELGAEPFGGLIAPMGVPAAIVSKLEGLLEEATKDSDFIAKAEAGGAQIAFANRNEFSKALNDITEKFGTIVRENNMKPE